MENIGVLLDYLKYISLYFQDQTQKETLFAKPNPTTFYGILRNTVRKSTVETLEVMTTHF